MDVRNIIHQKKDKKQKKVITIWSILIGIGLIYLLWHSIWIGKINQNQYFIGQEIYISGIIIQSDHFPLYTHELIQDETSKIWLISQNINLNNFLWEELIIKGKVSDITKWYPIAQLNEIINPNQQINIKENKYIFNNELLSFDFSKDIKLLAKKQKNTIKIFFDNENILSIETFICNKVMENQDCEKLKNTYNKNLNEVFSSHQWNTFYKISENTRITFNENTLGYIFQAENNDTILNMSNLIDIINPMFIAQQKSELISQNCIYQPWENLEIFENIDIKIVDDNLLRLDISWLSNKQNKLECNLIIDLIKWRNIKNTITKKI